MSGSHDSDKTFAGSIPEVYDKYLVPFLFEPYAMDLSTRLAARRPRKLLELAAGTGAVTRRLALELPDTAIVATDLNQPMLDRANAVGTVRPVTWRQADAQQLPFEDASFDVVVCQFGVMFFPDRPRAFAEVRRVLGPGGVFVFSAWDRLEHNEIPATVNAALAGVFPDDPPDFLARTPHAYHDGAQIRRDLAAGGFAGYANIDVVAIFSRAASARVPAIGFTQGTPIRNEIVARDPAKLSVATDEAERALVKRFGAGAIDGKIQALVVEMTK